MVKRECGELRCDGTVVICGAYVLGVGFSTTIAFMKAFRTRFGNMGLDLGRGGHGCVSLAPGFSPVASAGAEGSGFNRFLGRLFPPPFHQLILNPEQVEHTADGVIHGRTATGPR